MNRIFTLIGLLLTVFSGSNAQCTSSASVYDLVVTGNVALAPSGPQFTMGYVCSGGLLIDSTTCCTRLIHVEAGGIYEAGPNAYGFVYLKSGATFDAHGNNSFFMVAYEAGASILNFTGPQTLCSPVVFPSANCTVGTSENKTNISLNIHPNPCTDFLTIDTPSNFINETITIYDIAGRTPKQPVLEIIYSKSIDVSWLAPGIYLIQVMDEKLNKVTERFVKM